MYQQFPSQVLKILDSILRNLLKIEIAVIILVLCGILIQYYSHDVAEFILIIPLISLSILYFFSAYQQIDNRNKWDDFYLKTRSYSLSIFTICILFILNNYPGGLVIHTASLVSLSFALLMSFTERMFLNKGQSVSFEDLTRLLVALAITGLMVFTPHYKSAKQNEAYQKGEWEQFEKYDKEQADIP